MKISIITPCRNSERTIERTIESVVNQNLDNHELEYIIVDGKSTDSTLEIIKDYAKKYPFIKYLSEKDNCMTEALNKGMKMSTGDIVGSINADDVYLDGVLKNVCNHFLDSREKIVMVNTYFVNEGGYVKSHNKPHMFSPILCALVECPFPECSIFMRRDCIEKVGFFNENIKYTQDLELYLRLYSKKYKFSYLNIDGSCFFVSNTNYSSVISDEMRQEVCRYIAHKKIYKYISGSFCSKVLKAVLGLRHYYIFKKFTYDDILSKRI